jgi:hypothetical protein
MSRYTRAIAMRFALRKPRNPDVAACVLVSVLVLALGLLGTALIFFSFGMPLL